jgi:hypothetical protein
VPEGNVVVEILQTSLSERPEDDNSIQYHPRADNFLSNPSKKVTGDSSYYAEATPAAGRTRVASQVRRISSRRSSTYFLASSKLL